MLDLRRTRQMNYLALALAFLVFGMLVMNLIDRFLAWADGGRR